LKNQHKEFERAIEIRLTDEKNQVSTQQNELLTQQKKLQGLNDSLQYQQKKEQQELRRLREEQEQLVQKQQEEQLRLQMLQEEQQRIKLNSEKIAQKARSMLQMYQSITKCFYTAIIGKPGQEVDTLGHVERIQGWDYICFTNQSIQAPKGWTIVPVTFHGSDPAVEAKRYKWLSHHELLDYDVVVWVDGYITPDPRYCDLLRQWIVNMKETNIKVLHRPHDTRKCIWEECDAVVKYKRDTKERVGLVRDELHLHKMPKDWGLFDTNIVIKFHKDDVVQKMGEEIYKQISSLSNRDQLAVTFMYFKHKFTKFSTLKLLQAFQKNGNHIRHDI
jgi:hypothetical protein